jgi:glycosyltransferase involved in cell wall biosynthesis
MSDRANTRGQRRRILVVAGYFPPAQHGGGPVRSIVAMLRRIPDGFQTTVLTRNTDVDSAAPLTNHAGGSVVEWAPGIGVRYVSTRSFRSVASALLGVRRWKPDIIFLNSFFDPSLAIAFQLLIAVKLLQPRLLLLAPRGEFSEGALRLKSRKKAAYIGLYKALRLHKSVAWIASTDEEAADIRRTVDRKARIIVRQNDVELPARAAVPPARDPCKRLRLVHFGRCVPKKGLDIALEALKTVEAPVEFDIFGNEEDRSYTDRCKEIAAELPERSRARFFGHIDAESVRDTIEMYDAALFPTLGENFGHVIAESLSVGCPVMVSDTTPWSETMRHGGGFVVVPNTPQSWAKAIDDYFRVGPTGWAGARSRAAAAYEDWFGQTVNQPHIFELAAKAMLELEQNAAKVWPH